MSRIGLPLLKL